MLSHLPAPELVEFPSSDGAETLYAALYIPDARIHGPGPYPLICAVYGGPHVQRVNRSWSQCADMRAQRLRSLGFCVAKCDNRGSLKFESSISKRLGRLEVLDQVAAVRYLVARGIADATRVGIYGWSYGGYLSAMCLCRAPDVFHVAVAGAPVTSWDGYDTHYTERYMGLPAENPHGYRESAVLDHVPNMRGKLLLVHGLIDENVHFRHTARLINRLIAAGKDYDLLLFPDERHSPRRLRDRIYMEQRISDYFLRHLGGSSTSNIAGSRAMAGL
jgi:dipeptidyl-peptidase-4